MKRAIYRIFLVLLLAGFIVMSFAGQSAAKDFYEGKTIRILVCCSPGGFYDRWARLFARHMGQYIPGKPDIIVQNMPGAGSLIAANYVYNIAKQDGTALVMPLAGLIDIGRERERLEREAGRLEGRMRGMRAKLANENFVTRAPAAVVERERDKLATCKVQFTVLQEKLTSLAGQRP